MLAIVSLALVVRGGVLFLQYDNLNDDPDAYRAFATTLVETGRYAPGRSEPASAYRPPLVPLVLALCIKAPVATEQAFAIVHLVLGLATVWIVLLLARQMGLGRSGTVAAILVACDPILLHQSTLVMTETLATFLAVSILYVLNYGGREMTPGRAAVVGAGFALAALCRPAFLAVAGLSLIFLLTATESWKRRLAVGAVYMIAGTIVLVPWAARNYLALGRPIIATTHGGYTLLLGNNPSFYAYLRDAAWGEVWNAEEERDGWWGALSREAETVTGNVSSPANLTEVARDRWMYDMALENIRSEPGMFAYACVVRVGRLWQLMPHGVEPAESRARRLLRLAVAAWYLFVFALAVIGVIRLGRAMWSPPWVGGLLLCLGFTLVHTVYWSNMRMRAPLMPAVALAAAVGAARLGMLSGGCKYCHGKDLAI